MPNFARLRRVLALPAAIIVMLPVASRAQAAVLTVATLSGDVDIGMPDLPMRVRRANAVLARRMVWRGSERGVQVASLDLRAGTFAIPITATVVRVAPNTVRWTLQHRVTDDGMTGTWTIDSAGATAMVAMNAGQFKDTGPWGWLVIAGEERRSPLRAPLAIGIRIDTTGRLHWVPPGREMAMRDDPTTAYAFQSFPRLYFNRALPPILRDTARVDLAHRDARLVLGETDNGTLLIVITRFAGLGSLLERTPVGLTTPETVALMAALGARHAVMLDGGASAQLVVRDGGDANTWRRGLRFVPLGLVAERRREH